MIDLDDAFKSVVKYLEASILGIGFQIGDHAPDDPTPVVTDLGKPILSKGFFNISEKAGRVLPAPPDPKWIKEHVPGLAFWPIGFAPVSDYHIKKKVVEKDEATLSVKTREEFYRAKILIQAEMNARSNFERTMFLAQISSLFNTVSRGTGRLKTLKGDYVYLKLLESREPQDPQNTEQGIYRLVMTWELRVRDLVETVEPMFKSARYILKYNGEMTVLPHA